MYTTRSEQSRQKKEEQQLRRKKRFRRWILLNGILASTIILVGVIYWMQEQSSTPSVAIVADHQDNSSSNVQEPQSVGFQPEDTASDDTSGEEAQEAQPDSDQEAEQNIATNEEEPGTNQPAPTDTTEKAEDSEASAPNKTSTGSEAANDKANSSATLLAPQTNTAPNGQSVTLNFGGDVMFSGKVGELLAKKGYDYPYQYVKKLFTTDDLTVVNLETPVTSASTTAADKTYTFKSSPEALPHMADAGIDAVNLANNHILDQGVVGLTDTIHQLDASGVKYVGAGSDAKRAYEPVIFERKGIRIALLGFSRVIPKASWNAGSNQPGVATAYDATAAEAAIRKAKANADLVVVVAHWGVERSDTIVDHQSDLAHRFVDAGADLVVGGHPHVLQGVEQYKGKWIAYSTGNFIFTRSLTEKTWDTGVFQAVCTAKGDCSMKVIPYTATLGQPVPMEQQPAQALLQRLQSLSKGIRFDVKGNAIP